MTSKEIITEILNKRLPDRMGVYEHFWPGTFKRNWISQGYPAGANPHYYFDLDIIDCGGYINAEPYPRARTVLVDNENQQTIRNGFGATMRVWKNGFGTPEHIAFDLDCPAKWDYYRQALLSVEPERCGNIESIKFNLVHARKKQKFTVFCDVFAIELMRAAMGEENFLPALLLEPGWIEDFCRVYLKFYKKHYKLIFDRSGLPDGFFIYEDFGYNKGLFCSPAVMRRVFLPVLKEWVRFLHSYNLPVILHSCGNITEAIPLFIEAGIDCLQPLEVKADCDLVRIAELAGNKLSFMGNFDARLLSTNDTVLLEKEIQAKLAIVKQCKLPYVFHSDHSVPEDVDLSTYKNVLQMFRKNCSY